MSDLRGLSLRQLRALAATVELGSVSAAARQLYVTPPAISIQLKLLAKIAGAEIVQRTPTGFEPTDVGRELLTAANEIDRLLGRFQDRIAALKAGATGLVSLGVVSTGKYFAPAIVAAFQRAEPGIVVKLSIGNRSEIIKGLEQHEFDLLIMGRPPEHVEVMREILGDHPHILIAPPDHPLANQPGLGPEDLAQQTFLAREEGSGTRMLMARFIDRMGGRSYKVVEMGTNETIKQAVMAGLGIAIISAHTCASELAQGKLIALQVGGLPIVRQWYLIHRIDRELSHAARRFQSFVANNKPALLPR
ncbi:MAG: LysR family transcriptional regulator [Phycisphaerales bacterium]|nr:LysR family transcriptional regulator [Hyphomonadaceae bacterium]